MTTASTAFVATALALAACLSTPLAAQAADGVVETVSVRAVARFDFDRASIRPEDRDAILAEVGKMKDVTWQTVTATGYTDAVGRADYNKRLSARRANTVKAYLVGKGLMPAMIKAEGKASAAPVADNDSEAGRAKNRRAEIEFQGVRVVAAK
ncbi:MAG: OmpA family protein [Burkholderiales bacterium]